MAGEDDAGKKKTGGESLDSNLPYYIHPSDYPKQMQVNDALKAYYLVAEDERQRAITAGKQPTTDVAAFKAFVPGRRENGSSQRRSKPSFADHCTYCKKDGHTRDGCFKRIGYPEWWPGNRRREETKPKVACVKTTSCPIPGLTNEQYKKNLRHFADMENTNKGGTTPMTCMTGKNDNDYWVIDSGSTVKYQRSSSSTPNTQKLHTRSLIGAGECKGGLYRMGLFKDRRRAMMTSGDMWHKRLGHASNEKLTYIDFLNKVSFSKSCDSCSKAKHTRLPFSKSDIKTI